jgi:hypothetical protein
MKTETERGRCRRHTTKVLWHLCGSALLGDAPRALADIITVAVLSVVLACTTAYAETVTVIGADGAPGTAGSDAIANA